MLKTKNMKQVFIRRGRAISGCQYHRWIRSNLCDLGLLLSIGTEYSAIKGSAVPMWRRALKEPSKLVTATQLAIDHGVSKAYERSLLSPPKNIQQGIQPLVL